MTSNLDVHFGKDIMSSNVHANGAIVLHMDSISPHQMDMSNEANIARNSAAASNHTFVMGTVNGGLNSWHDISSLSNYTVAYGADLSTFTSNVQIDADLSVEGSVAASEYFCRTSGPTAGMGFYDNTDAKSFEIGFYTSESSSNAFLANKTNNPTFFETNSVPRLTLNSNGDLYPFASNTYNLGTAASRWHTGYFSNLDLDGAFTSRSALFKNGNNYTSTALKQLLFGFNGTDGYQHCIATRHESRYDNNGNSIDFLLWQTSDAGSNPGTKRVMTVGSESVEITNAIDVGENSGFNVDCTNAHCLFRARLLSSNHDQNAGVEIGTITGNTPYIGANQGIGSDGSTINTYALHFRTSNVSRMIIDAAGHFLPYANNVSSCGTSSSKWTAVYATNGTIQTSDDRVKSDEVYLSNALDTMDKLKPQTYTKWSSMDYLTDSNAWNIQESGLIAQEVFYDAPELRHLIHLPADADSNVLYTSNIVSSSDPSVDPDYSGWGSAPAGINYAGLIPYLVGAIKELKQVYGTEIDALKARITDLESP